MTLQEQLDALKTQSVTRIPPDARAIMQRAVDDLRESGILDRTLKVGDRAPDFTLPNDAGQPVSLGEIRTKGPVVLSFYRGRW